MKTIFTSAIVLMILTFGITINPQNSYADFYINQDFDNSSFPPPGWQLANTTGYNLIRTSYCSGYGVGSASAIADFYDYNSGNFELITSTFPAAVLTDSLIFDHAYAPATTENDHLDIYTSSDNGATWNLLITLNGGTSGPLRTGNPTYDMFVPTSSQWATKRYGLPAGTNKVKFTCVTAFGNNLYLDNIRIGTPYSNDAGVSGIMQPKWGITPQSMAPKATVKNFGTTMQSFNVTMTITPGGYTNTQPVSNLAPGATQDITFSSYNFSTTGNYTLRAYTSLGSDQNISNDSLANPLVVSNTLRNEVLEFCTGTWCQWCPCGEDEVHHLKAVYPNSVVLAYHGAGSDPWRIFNGSGIISMLGFPGYPSGLIDRRLGSNNGWGAFFIDGEYRYSQSPASPINIATTNINYNGSTGELTVNLDATAMTDLTGQFKVNYVLTEDNLVYPQTGNSYCPGNSTWVHDWIVRTIVNTVSGDNVNSGNWNASQVIPLSFTTTLDPSWAAANCKFNVFIFKDNGGLSVSEIQQAVSYPVVTVGVSQTGSNVPDKYELSQNYPNPFNPVTNIKFSVPNDGNVSLKIYDMLGKLVSTYLDGFVRAGVYNAEVDGSNMSSGIYFYRLTAGDYSDVKKMMLVK